MKDYRYITYVSQDMPGNRSFDLERVTSLEAAKDTYRAFCEAVGADECTASLYGYSEEDWASAEDFRNTGIPFDYPWKLIERGPRGGVRVVEA